jgi:trigger factor
MQVSIETLSGLERRLVVEIPSEEVESLFHHKLAEVSRQVKIKGFRPGKVPDSEVRRRYGDSVRHDVVVDLIEKSYWKAIVQEKLVPAGAPSIEPLQDREGEDLKFSAVFEVYPAFIVKGLNQVTINRPSVEVTEDDIHRLIERLRRQFATRVEKTADAGAVAAFGDWLYADVVMTQSDGKQVFNAVGEQCIKTELTENYLEVPSLGAQIVGMKVGDRATFPVTLPDAHPLVTREGAEKEVSVEVAIQKIEILQLPEIDEAFFNRFEMDADRPENLEAFRARIRKQLEVERDRYVEKIVEGQVSEGVLAHNMVDVPKALIERQVDRMIHQFVKENKMDKKQADKQLLKNEGIRSLFRKNAEKMVRFGLLLSEIIKKQKLTADEQSVRARVETDAIYYSDPEQYIEWVYGEEKNLESYRTMVLEQQAVRYIISQAEVIDQPMSFEELTQKQNSQAVALTESASVEIEEEEHVHDENCQHEHEHVHDENCQHEHHR